MELVAKCDRFSRLKHSTAFPLVFTEHGAIMAANVLNSQRAIEASVYVVRAFVNPGTGTFLELPRTVAFFVPCNYTGAKLDEFHRTRGDYFQALPAP